jgi:hypothetical protein
MTKEFLLLKSCSLSFYVFYTRKEQFANFYLLNFPSIFSPEKNTEIFFERTTPNFRCISQLLSTHTGQSICVMQYQNENIFIAYLTGKRALINKPYFALLPT